MSEANQRTSYVTRIRLVQSGPGQPRIACINRRSWTYFTTMSAYERNQLRDFNGSDIKIHPEDYDELAGLGLAFRLQPERDVNGAVRLVRKPMYDAPLVEIGAPS